MIDGYRFTVGDKTYVADITKIKLDEWIDMERATGAPPVVLVSGMDMRSAVSIKAFLWIAKRRAGESIEYSDVDLPLFGGDFHVETTMSESAAAEQRDGRGKEQDATGLDDTPEAPQP